jgi:predicted GNAT family acetyltransferase
MMGRTPAMAELRDNVAKGRFELDEGGSVVFADYRRAGPSLIIDHVETPPALRGAGAAGRLMEAIASRARGDGVKIVPLCSYAAAWLARRPEHADLL